MTKMERAFNCSLKKAKEYTDNHSKYFRHEYCISSDQLKLIEDTWIQGFIAGVSFK